MNKLSPFFYTISMLILTLGMHKSNAQSTTPELSTDRPDQTESAMLVPQGTIQLETGFMIENDNNVTNYTYNTSLFRYGVNQHLEFRLITEYLGTKTEITDGQEINEDGFSPLALGVKLKVAEANGIVPETAFIGHVTMRTGSREYQPEHIAADFRFTMEYDLSSKFSLGINLGAEWDGSSSNASGIYTVVVGTSLSDRIGFFAEAYGFATEQTAVADHRFNAGLTYAVSDLIQYDISSGFGLSATSPDNFISTGLSLRFPR